MHIEKKIASLVGAIAVTLAGCTIRSDPFETSDLFLDDVAVIDVVDGSITRNQTIVIRGNTIHTIRSSRRVRVPADARTLVSGGYVVPGLWDMHVHSLSDPDTALRYDFPLFLANGIVGVRDMGSLVDGIVETRARLADDPSIPAPQLYVSGPLLDGQKLPWYGDLPLVLESREDAVRELPRLQAAGMDFLKVYDGLPREAYDAVLAYGSAHGLPIAGHVPRAVSIRDASEAGQVTMEHLSPFGLRDCLADSDMWFQRAINAKFREGYQAYFKLTLEAFEALDEETCTDVFETMAVNGTFFTPTLVMEVSNRGRIPEADLAYLRPEGRGWCEDGLTGIDQADEELREQAYAAYGSMIMTMKEAGITILAGSDMPNNCLVPGYGLHWELARMIEAGFSPLEALQATTLHAAAVMDRRGDLGQVAEGYAADLLILDANPLEDIQALRQSEGVLVQGRWYDRAALDQFRTQVAESFDAK